MDVLTGLALSIVFAVTPMVLFARVVTRFDQYEKEPTLLLITMFLWGFFIAAGAAAVINTLVDQVLYMLTGSMNLSLNITAVVTGPFTEEFLKGSAIVILFVFFRKYFNTVLDGIIYGGLIGFGFAAAENILYIFGGFSAEGVYGLFSVALARILLIPFLHATLTSFTGLGFALARTRKDSIGYIAPVGGFLLAVSMHSLHNLLAVSSNVILLGASFLLDWMGVVALLILVYRLMAEENGIMKKYLEIGKSVV